MNIFKIVAVGLVGAILSVSIKSYRPEYGILVGAASGVIILLMICDGLFSALGAVETIIEKTGLDSEYFRLTVKAIGISYITQFAAELCRDAGEGAVAAKIDSAGRVFIMVLTVPVMSGFLNIITDMLSAV